MNAYDLFRAVGEVGSDLVEEAAADVNAGSNSYFYLPSLRGLIADDDTGYANLQFTIYYKTSSSSSASTSSDLDADE